MYDDVFNEILCMFVYVYLLVCMYACTYVCMYVSMHVFMYACMYIMYVCMHVGMHDWTHGILFFRDLTLRNNFPITATESPNVTGNYHLSTDFIEIS